MPLHLSMKTYLPCLLLSLFFFPTLVLSECTCNPDDEDRNKHEALKLKLAAFASILVAGAIGVSLPSLGKLIPALGPDRNIFFLVKAFAAGVILSTGFVHILPDAYENLTSPCLSEHPWGDFPFTGLAAMVTAILTLLIDALASSYFNKVHHQERKCGNGGDEENKDHVHVHTHATHGHAHASITADSEAKTQDTLRQRVVSQVLELGIIVHSVIIGISLGASQSPKTIRPLVAALTFHQFFEGMGLGGCISQAKFKSKDVIIMSLFFSLTTPIGIAVGIGISDVYDETSPTALIVEGILNAASAGILIYMALVDLLSPDFMNPKMQTNFKLQLGASAFLIMGAGFMSLLAIWA